MIKKLKPVSKGVKESALFHAVLSLRKKVQLHNEISPNKVISLDDIINELKRQEGL